MVLAKGVHVGTLFHLDACTIKCSISSIFAMEGSIGSTPSQSEPISTSDGHALWVPIQSLASESKLLAKKTMLWNQRLGHIGEMGLQALKKKSFRWI